MPNPNRPQQPEIDPYAVFKPSDRLAEIYQTYKIGEAAEPRVHHKPDGWDGGYRTPQERSDIIAKSRFSREVEEHTSTEAERKQRLDEVYEALDVLNQKAHPEVYVEVLEKVPLSVRAAQKLKFGKILGRGALSEKPVNVHTYQHGEMTEEDIESGALGFDGHGINRTPLRVRGRTAHDGWVLPRRIFAQEPNAEGQVSLWIDSSVPNAKKFSNLVIAADGRSWSGAYIAPVTMENGLTVGVQDHEWYGDNVLKNDTQTFNATVLKDLRDTILYMAENPLTAKEEDEQENSEASEDDETSETDNNISSNRSEQSIFTDEHTTTPMTTVQEQGQPAPSAPQPSHSTEQSYQRRRHRRATRGVIDSSKPAPGQRPPQQS